MSGKVMIFLIPPSEGKMQGGDADKEQLYFVHEKPLKIATEATQKDLKCTGKRYEEGIALNKTVKTGPRMEAIQRYTGVMFNAIGYETMTVEAQQFFSEHVLILSGLYGLLKPQNTIANYKLPVDTKGLRQWRGDRITTDITRHTQGIIVDLLPNAHKKLIDFGACGQVVHVDFFVDGKKMTHGVKGVKGQRLHDRCTEREVSIQQRPKKMTYKDKIVDLIYL